MSEESVLAIHQLTKQFGGHVAVKNVNLEIIKGDILGIIGPNGAGKSSFLNCIIGTYKPEIGEIFFKGENITSLSTHRIIRKGMSRTFQVPRVFQECTLLENMLTPVLHLKLPKNQLVRKASALLERLSIGGREHDLAMELSGGQQKLLEFARSLMLDPDVLLLDEPFAGVHPTLKEVMVQGIREVHKEGVTMMIVSHDLPPLYKLTNDIIVLNQGEIIARGNPKNLQNDSVVVNAYFGR
ncbi:MAG: ABC transporter ATP-binding protein [Dethiobacter sp.]|jgi:branched-chain amino acid transport system ATP-binding protein|nr:ABC transporter ATP-binding protein [Dethiobacter sp.]